MSEFTTYLYILQANVCGNGHVLNFYSEYHNYFLFELIKIKKSGLSWMKLYDISGKKGLLKGFQLAVLPLTR